MNLPVVALAGNPNVGKSTLFNLLTGEQQQTSNWTGTTVACAQGVAQLANQRVRLVDLPGVYSLTPYADDEATARDFLLTERVDLLVNVVDAANLERNLYLTTQLLETGIPTVIIVNKIDVATRRGLHLDVPALSAALSIPATTFAAGHGADTALLCAWLGEHVTARLADEVRA